MYSSATAWDAHLIGVQPLGGSSREELLVVWYEGGRDGGGFDELLRALQGTAAEGLLHEAAEAPGIDGPHRAAD